MFVIVSIINIDINHQTLLIASSSEPPDACFENSLAVSLASPLNRRRTLKVHWSCLLLSSFSPCCSQIMHGQPMGPPRHTVQAMGQSFVIDSEYEYIKDLGQGAYGCVLAARHRRSGDGCAIKKITNVNTKVRSSIVLSAYTLAHVNT